MHYVSLMIWSFSFVNVNILSGCKKMCIYVHKKIKKCLTRFRYAAKQPSNKKGVSVGFKHTHANEYMYIFDSCSNCCY